MSFSKFVKSKNNYKLNSNDVSKNLYKGACVKIKDSQKTFQVLGINPKSKVCWIREWPFSLEVNQIFSLEINQITLQTFCSKSIPKKWISQI